MVSWGRTVALLVGKGDLWQGKAVSLSLVNEGGFCDAFRWYLQWRKVVSLVANGGGGQYLGEEGGIFNE